MIYDTIATFYTGNTVNTKSTTSCDNTITITHSNESNLMIQQQLQLPISTSNPLYLYIN